MRTGRPRVDSAGGSLDLDMLQVVTTLAGRYLLGFRVDVQLRQPRTPSGWADGDAGLRKSWRGVGRIILTDETLVGMPCEDGCLK